MKMTFLKRSLPCFLLISLNTLAFAATAPATKSTNIPTISPGFGFNLTGLYLQPGASNLQYATYTQPLPAPAPHWKTKNVTPDFHPAFSAGMQYTFSTGVDQIKFDWLHVDTHDSSTAGANGSASVAPNYYFGPLAQALFNSSARGSAEFNVDNLKLAYDHMYNIGRYIQFTPSAGFDYAYLKQYLKANYQGDDAAGNHYNITSYGTSKYMGFGPHFGFNATAYVFRHFGILAEVGGSVLLGSMDSNTSFLSQGRDNPTAVHTSMANQTLTRIVPELDSKLGLTYQFAFHSGSSLEIQTGYVFDLYFNGINQVVPTSLVPDQFNHGVVAIETSGQDQSNLDLSGPYLKVAFLFT